MTKGNSSVVEFHSQSFSRAWPGPVAGFQTAAGSAACQSKGLLPEVHGPPVEPWVRSCYSCGVQKTTDQPTNVQVIPASLLKNHRLILQLANSPAPAASEEPIASFTLAGVSVCLAVRKS